MSHANGEIWSADRSKLLGHFEYNGTSDVVCSRIRATNQEVQEHWRKDNFGECTCGGDGEDVILYTDYGAGFFWLGKACFKCMTVIDGLMPFDPSNESDGITDGHPSDQESL